MKRLISLLAVLVLVLALGVVSASAQFSDSGQVRFVHAIPGVTAVDIYTDGQLTVSGLGYGTASNYITAPAGERQITVRPRGLTTVLWQQTVNVTPSPQTLIASTIDPLQFNAYADDFSPLELGQTRLKIIHAIAGGPTVDVLAGSDAITQGLSYGGEIGTFDIPADTYDLSIVVSGAEDVVLPATPFGLVGGTAQMVIAYGTAAIPEVMVLSAPTVADGPAGFLRIGHAVAEAPAVDVYAADTLLVPGLEFGQTTEHLAIPEGTYAVELRVAGTTETVLTTEVSIADGSAQTAVALGTLETLDVVVFTDDISGISDSQALVSVINTIPDGTVSVTLADGTVLAADLPFGEISNVTNVEPGTQSVRYVLTIDGDSASLELTAQSLYGGVYYNALVTEGSRFTPPALTFAATSLAQSVASAPGADDVVVVEAPPVEEPAVEEPAVEEPVEEPAIEEPVEDPPVEEPPAVEEPQPEPTEAPAPTIVEAQPTAVPPGPTARILLDPGANLHLRQYPSSEALSLGLAPSGTVLNVNGREGAPIDLDGNEMQVEDEDGEMIDWVDPVELLEDEDDDLIPAETWLNVVYNTPDGGTITAWISAQFIELRDEANLRMRLAELPTIPANRPGEAVNTSITPPSAREDRVTVRVINLDFGVNLNLRRTPDSGGEVLARIPLNTVLDFVGLGESEDWAFVSFGPPEGGQVRGWVSTRFITYEFNNRSITLEELAVRNLLEYVDEETVRGAITAGTVPQVVAPTVDPQINAYVAEVMVDADANLNLRRSPSDQAEVIARIPAATRLIIDGRTADGEWLQTTFENQVGWVASDFVALTFNNVSVQVDEVPVITIPEPETEGEDENQG